MKDKTIVNNVKVITINGDKITHIVETKEKTIYYLINGVSIEYTNCESDIEIFDKMMKRYYA